MNRGGRGKCAVDRWLRRAHTVDVTSDWYTWIEVLWPENKTRVGPSELRRMRGENIASVLGVDLVGARHTDTTVT